MCGLSRAALRRRRCRLVAARWAQRHSVIINNELYENFTPSTLGGEWLDQREAELGASLGDLHFKTKEVEKLTRENTVFKAREHILQAQIDHLTKSSLNKAQFDLPSITPLRSPPKLPTRTLKRNSSEESSASCSTRCPEEDEETRPQQNDQVGQAPGSLQKNPTPYLGSLLSILQ